MDGESPIDYFCLYLHKTFVAATSNYKIVKSTCDSVLNMTGRLLTEQLFGNYEI